MKSRDWLISQGLAKPTRGRLSREAKAALERAIADGMKFSDISSNSTGEIKKVVPNSEFTDYTPPSQYRYPEHAYEAIARENGKTVRYGMREVCNNCRVSLVGHRCDSPTILYNIPVTIRPKG